MTLIAAILLSAAAAFGAGLALVRLRGADVPLATGIAHGSLALAGVVALGAAVWRTEQPIPVNATLLYFTLGLLGGLFVLLFRLDGDAPPGFMIVLHAAVALLALVLLWIGLAPAQ